MCAAIAERTQIDVTLIRIAFVVLALAKGIGIIVYAGLWLALPGPGGDGRLRDRLRADRLSGELSRAQRSLGRAWRSTASERTTWPRPMDRRWLAIGLIAFGGLVVLVSFGAFSWLTIPRAIGLTALAVGAGTLLTLAGHGGRR